MAVKSVLKITAYSVAFVISLIIILALLVDANMFKPRIQALAEQQGIALNMRGDLSWAFWPAIGLAVNDVSVADSNAPQKIIADVKKASFLIAFVPLLQGDFQIKHVSVDGAVIDLDVDEQGVGNWEKLIKKSSEQPTDARAENSADANSKDLKLAIEKISLKNSRLSYANLANGQKIALNNINLGMKDVNVKGAPFELDAAWETEFSQTKTKAEALLIKSKFHSNLIVGEGFQSLALDKGELQLSIHAKETANLKITASLHVDDLKNNLHYQGKIVVAPLNAKQLLVAFGIPYTTANAKALTEVGFAGDIDGDKKRITFKGVNIQVDKTRINGTLAVTDFTSKAITVDLHGDTINLDDYLAPAAPEVATEQQQSVASAPAVAAATGDEPLLPLPLLRSLNMQAKMAFDSLLLSQMQLEKLLADVDARQGISQQNINFNLYGGSIHVKSRLDARGEKAQIGFEAIVKTIDIAEVLKAKKFDKSINLTGKLDANATGQTNGVTTNQLVDSLTARLNFSGDKMRLAPLNIEQQFCKLVNLVNQQPDPQETWNAYTELQKVSGKVDVAKRVITVESVNANVEKLMLGTTGNLNLVNGTYDFLLPLKLNRDANDTPTSIVTSTHGCKVNSNYWVERSMTLLRCKGAYAQMNPAKDCRPDKDQLNLLVKDFAAYKLKEKHGEKIEAKKSELIKKLDEKLGGEGKAEKTKDVLKNLFKKKNDN